MARPANYYALQIDKAISRHENYKYADLSISWISDRIVWCNRFHKITPEQTASFCDRVISLLERGI